MSATIARRRPGLAWVAVLSVIEMIAVAAGAGPPVQPLLSILFVLTCPGFLLLDLANPRDPVARVMLGIGGSLAVNVSLITIALVGDIRLVAPVLVLALAFLALLPRAALRRGLNSIKSTVRRTEASQVGSTALAADGRLTPVYVDLQSTAHVEQDDTVVPEDQLPPTTAEVEPVAPLADDTTEEEQVAPAPGTDVATEATEDDYAAQLGELRAADDEYVDAPGQEDTAELVDEDIMSLASGTVLVEDDATSTSDEEPPGSEDEEPGELIGDVIARAGHDVASVSPDDVPNVPHEEETPPLVYADGTEVVDEEVGADKDTTGPVDDIAPLAEEEDITEPVVQDPETLEDEVVSQAEDADTTEVTGEDLAASVELEQEATAEAVATDTGTPEYDTPFAEDEDKIPSQDQDVVEPVDEGESPSEDEGAAPTDDGELQPPPVVIFGVDINRAGPDSIAAFPGMEPRPAALIVAYRDRHGPFKDGKELLKLLRAMEAQQKANTP